MPLYEYLCQECHARFERLILSREAESAICPHCDGRQTRRLMSVIAGLSRGAGAGTGPPMNRGGCCGGACPSCN
ncbi:MAG: FmdB family zinc ribbon protein [Actinomycetota bacterium]